MIVKLMRFFILSIFFFVGLASADTEPKTYKLAITDVVGLEELQREFGQFVDLLKKESGLSIEFMPVTSRTIVVEALKNQKVDFVLAGPAEYIVIRKKSKAKPLVRFSRPDYYSCLVVLADSGIVRVEDLRGKKVGFGDIGSTSYHLGPMQLINDAGLDPRNDIKPVHVSKHVGWDALKRGDIVALGLKHEQFKIFRAKETKLEPAAFRVLLRGPDLPDDLLIAGEHIEDDVAQKVKDTFVNHSQALIKAILVGQRNQKYFGMKFLADVKDSDYNYVRKMYATAGFAEFSG